MSPAPVKCPKCQAPLDGGSLNQPELLPCPNCQTPLQVEVYPALFRRVAAGRSGDLVVVDGEATCFYHPAKKAVRPCDGCGRFMCALCDCELLGAHYCPACLEVGKKKGKIKSLENRRMLYDSLALGLAFWPLLCWPLTVFSAPVALFIAIRHWNSPRSIIHRTRIRFVFAIIMALLQIAGWVLLIFTLVNNHSSNV